MVTLTGRGDNPRQNQFFWGEGFQAISITTNVQRLKCVRWSKSRSGPGPSSIISEVLEAARDVGLALEKQTKMVAWTFLWGVLTASKLILSVKIWEIRVFSRVFARFGCHALGVLPGYEI